LDGANISLSYDQVRGEDVPQVIKMGKVQERNIIPYPSDLTDMEWEQQPQQTAIRERALTYGSVGWESDPKPGSRLRRRVCSLPLIQLNRPEVKVSRVIGNKDETGSPVAILLAISKEGRFCIPLKPFVSIWFTIRMMFS